MHTRVFAEFERICAARGAGGDVLEVGAVPSQDSLLCLPALAGAKSKVGINLDGPSRYADFEILRADANALTCFADESFDTVLCNSVLEHDKHFWKSLSEMKRVTRPGGSHRDWRSWIHHASIRTQGVPSGEHSELSASLPRLA